MKLAWFTFWIFDRPRQQQRPIQGVAQSNGCGNIALQMGNDCRNVGRLFTEGNNGSYGQGNTNYPIQVGEARSVLEIGNGEGPRGHLNIHPAQFEYAGIRSIDDVGHNFFPLLKSRFGRSCLAFVNAWRSAA